MKWKFARDRAKDFLLIALLMAADRASKIWAIQALGEGGVPSVTAIPGVIRLTLTWNRGAAFSLLRSQPWIVIALSALLLSALMLAILFARTLSRRAGICACFVFAGGAGNLIDRIVYGAVVDFIEFRVISFPVFNVSDIFVTVGAGLFVLFLFWNDRKKGADA